MIQRCRQQFESGFAQAGAKRRTSRCKAPAEKFLSCLSTFLCCPSRVRGHYKSRVGTSFPSTLTVRHVV